MSIVNKVTNKAGSSIFSLGLGGGTVKKTRKSKAKRASGSKSLRSTADGLKVKKYSLIKGKRVSKKIVKKTKRVKKSAGDVIAAEHTQVAVKEENGASQAMEMMQLKQQLADAKDAIAAERTQVAVKEENGASQAREIMLLKQQLADADKQLKRSQANETHLVDRVAELEIENAELSKVQQSGRSDSGQALTDANKHISELKQQLTDALAASHESAELRADGQYRITELEQQLADGQQRNSELEKQLADALEKIERCKKALVKQQKIIRKSERRHSKTVHKSKSLKALQTRLEAESPSPPKPGERKMRPRSGYRLPEGANLAKQQTEEITRSRASQKAMRELKQRNSKIEHSGEQKCNDSKLLGVTKNFLREKRRASIGGHPREQKCSDNKLLGVTKNFFHHREREYSYTDFL